MGKTLDELYAWYDSLPEIQDNDAVVWNVRPSELVALMEELKR